MSSPFGGRNNKFIDLIVVFVLLFVALDYAYITKDLFIGRSLFTGLVLVVPPVIYLGIRNNKNWKKLIIASVIFGCLFGFALSFYAEATKAWSTNDYIFGFRLLGVNTLEEVFGQGLMALYTFTFYEHFLDNEKERKVNRNYVVAMVIGSIGSILLVGIYLLQYPNKIQIPYAYIFAAVLAIIPLILVVYKNPHLINKFALLASFFFIVWFSSQYFAVLFNYWTYPGSYIGWIEILGVRYPLEEMFFWMLLYSPTIVAYYEATIDDMK